MKNIKTMQSKTFGTLCVISLVFSISATSVFAAAATYRASRCGSLFQLHQVGGKTPSRD